MDDNGTSSNDIQENMPSTLVDTISLLSINTTISVITTTDLPAVDSMKLSQAVLYVISASSAIVCSMLIIGTIVCFKELHSKEYYLLSGLAG